MAKFLQLDLSGLDRVKNAIKNKEKDFTDGFDQELTASTLEMNRNQKRYAPVDHGRLRSSISFDVSKPFDKSSSVNVDYAPYVEFGTGGKVNVPAGLEEIAIQFKGQGKRMVNRSPQPFFFRAYFEEYPKLVKRIKNLLSK